MKLQILWFIEGALRRRTFRKFAFRGVDLDQLLDMGTDELVKLFTTRARRRFQRGLKRQPMALIKKLREAKRDAPQGEKPEPVRAHLRNMIIVPEMIGSIVGVYNGKTFNQVEIKVCKFIRALNGKKLQWKLEVLIAMMMEEKDKDLQPARPRRANPLTNPMPPRDASLHSVIEDCENPNQGEDQGVLDSNRQIDRAVDASSVVVFTGLYRLE